MRIRKIVKELINRHNTNSPFLICRDLDVILLRVPLVKVNGLYQRVLDQDIIYLSDQLNEEEELLILAHELGHLILHKDVNAIYLETYNQVVTRYELEANEFAILLLKDRLNLQAEIPLLDWTYQNEKLINKIS